MSIVVRAVRDDRDLERFLTLPGRLHAGDPSWVEPIGAWVRRRLSPRRNPFLRSAALVLFYAERDGEIVGTISALRDRQHEDVRAEKVAFFGFFECVDEPAVAAALFDAATDQAREWGADLLRGPRNLTRVEDIGLTIEGFEIRPPMLAGHHPPYYRALVEGAGFTAHHDHLAYDVELSGPDGAPRPLPPNLSEKADRVKIPGLVVRPFSWRHARRDLRIAHTVFVDAFRNVPENTPMPFAQFAGLLSVGLLFTSPRMLQLATVDGAAAGFAVCIPELNEAIVATQGRLAPLGWLRLLRAARRIRTASFKLLGVLPEFRASGLHALLIRRAIEGVRSAGYTRLEGSLIDERNGPMRHIVETAGMEPYRRYRVYDRAIPGRR